MKRGNLNKLITVITLIVFVVSNTTILTSAAGVTGGGGGTTIVTPPPPIYCDRTSSPVLAINLDGTEAKVSVDGVVFRKNGPILTPGPILTASVIDPTVTMAPFVSIAPSPTPTITPTPTPSDPSDPSATPTPSITPTLTPPAVNAFSRIEAKSFNAKYAFRLKANDANTFIGWIDTGDSIAYNNIYFPKGTKTFTVRAASNNNAGDVKVWLDNIAGNPIGIAHVSNTGGWENFKDFTCQLTKSVEGLHKVYIGFMGPGNGGGGDFGNIDYFQFGGQNAFDPIKASSHDASSGINSYVYKNLAFGSTDGAVIFKAHLTGNVSGTITIKTETGNIGTLNLNSANANGDVECIVASIKGIHDITLMDNSGGGNLSKIKWFSFTPIKYTTLVPPVVPLSDKSKLLSSNIQGYNLSLTATSLDKDSVYEVYLYTTDFQKENREIFDVSINGNKVDTIDSETWAPASAPAPYTWKKLGPYLTKVTEDNQTVNIQCTSKRGLISLAGIQINKVEYDSNAFGDIRINDNLYIPVMELSSEGIFNNVRFPYDTAKNKYNFCDIVDKKNILSGNLAAVMLFNFMRNSISKNEPGFIYGKLTDVPTNHWAYTYIKNYCSYFSKEKFSKEKISENDPTPVEKAKVRREEFALAMVGARRLDFNDDGRVFVLDPEREPESKLNLYKNTDVSTITDSFRYYVELALEKGIFKDLDGKLFPQKAVTFEDATIMLYNLLNFSENNFKKPSEETTIQAPRITATKRNINVGILTMPTTGGASDPNPDFTILEILNRDINKPMDWVLVNPHPPEYKTSDFTSAVLSQNTAPIKNDTTGISVTKGVNLPDFTAHYQTYVNQYNSSLDSYNNTPDVPENRKSREYYKSMAAFYHPLKNISREQSDLTADIYENGGVGNADNKNKSTFFKYWEVSIQDTSLTAEKMAKDYDILFQTSHSTISYTNQTDVEKMKSFLDNGGQLWWENCGGLVINGNGFTEKPTFVNMNTGNNVKCPLSPNYISPGKVHPLLDNIYKIDTTKSARPLTAALTDNSEITMLGDTDEWYNDDNRYIDSLKPTDTNVLYVQTPSVGLKPSAVVRNQGSELQGRIVITTSDIGCGITKKMFRSFGKSVEDYKFCYNLFGWMSRVDLDFKDTNSDNWDGIAPFTVVATITNYGARAQQYDLVPRIPVNSQNNEPWELIASTVPYSTASWTKYTDALGYPTSIILEANQSIEIRYTFKITSPQDSYEFGLKVHQTGDTASRDQAEDSYTLRNKIIPAPQIKINPLYVNCDVTSPASDPCGINSDIEVTINSPLSALVNSENAAIKDYELTLNFVYNKKSTLILPTPGADILDITESDKKIPASDPYGLTVESSNHSGTGTTQTTTFVIAISGVKFNLPSSQQYIKLKVPIKALLNQSTYSISGNLRGYDYYSGEFIEHSEESTPVDLPVELTYGKLNQSLKILSKDAAKKLNKVKLTFTIPQYSDELSLTSNYIEIYDHIKFVTNHIGTMQDITPINLTGSSNVDFPVLVNGFKKNTADTDYISVLYDEMPFNSPFYISKDLSANCNVIIELKMTIPTNRDIRAKIHTKSTALSAENEIIVPLNPDIN